MMKRKWLVLFCGRSSPCISRGRTSMESEQNRVVEFSCRCTFILTSSTTRFRVQTRSRSSRNTSLPPASVSIGSDTSNQNAMDYQGQKLSEILFHVIILWFGSIGWVMGYFEQDFVVVFKVWLVGVVLAVLVRFHFLSLASR